MAKHMKQAEDKGEFWDRHPRYRKWAIAWAIISVLVAFSSVTTTEYYEGEEGAMFIDFVFSILVTFWFWYGVTVLIGFIARKIKEYFDGKQSHEATEPQG